MWLANFEDGTSISSRSTYWTELSKLTGKAKLSGLQLYHSSFPNLQVSLSGMMKYYYMAEAVQFMMEGATPVIVAEVIGGIKNGSIVEVRMDYPRKVRETLIPGSIRTRLFELSEFRYAPEILVDGAK